jgi:hypothetical protein
MSYCQIYKYKQPTPETLEKKAITRFLQFKGIFYYHNLAGLGVYPGIPDLTAIKDGIVYQIEVKALGGRQSDYQKQFQENWEASGGTYIIGGIDEVMKTFP